MKTTTKFYLAVIIIFLISISLILWLYFSYCPPGYEREKLFIPGVTPDDNRVINKCFKPADDVYMPCNVNGECSTNDCMPDDQSIPMAKWQKCSQEAQANRQQWIVCGGLKGKCNRGTWEPLSDYYFESGRIMMPIW